jgi:hypothetical protein
MHFTMRLPSPAGGEGTAVLVSEHFSSVTNASSENCPATQDTASSGEILIGAYMKPEQ